MIENIAEPDTYKDFEKEVKEVGLTTKFWINKRSRTCVTSVNNLDLKILKGYHILFKYCFFLFENKLAQFLNNKISVIKI